MEYNEDDYYQIPDHLVGSHGHKFPFQVFIALSESKLIKISNSDDDIRELYQKYIGKKPDLRVLVLRIEFDDFMNTIKERTAPEKLAEMPLEDAMGTIETAHSFVMDNIAALGLSKVNAHQLKDLCESVGNVVSMNPKLNKLLEYFKTSSNEQFSKNTLIGHVACQTLDQFSWWNETNKEKVIAACFLCDLGLSPEDFDSIKARRAGEGELTAKANNHPLDICNMLEQSDTASKETIQMIMYHHEDAVGTGFPQGVKHQSVQILPAVFNVCHEFVELMSERDFNHDTLEECFIHLLNKFKLGNFKKASEALHNAIRQ